jgi:hypothetical protein
MKRIIVIVMLGLMLASCKKNSGLPSLQGIITATVDGTNYMINKQMGIARSKLPNDSTEYFILYGEDQSLNYMEVYVYSIHNLVARAYKQSQDSTEIVKIAFQQPNGDLYATTYTAANPSSITITSIDSTTIQGTFSGTLYDSGDSTRASKTVTNGTFILKI